MGAPIFKVGPHGASSSELFGYYMKGSATGSENLYNTIDVDSQLRGGVIEGGVTSPFTREQTRDQYYQRDVQILYNQLAIDDPSNLSRYSVGANFGQNYGSSDLYNVFSEGIIAREIAYLNDVALTDATAGTSYETYVATGTTSFDTEGGLAALLRAGTAGGENLGTVDVAQLIADAPNAFQIGSDGRIRLSSDLVQETRDIGGNVFQERGNAFVGEINKQLSEFRIFEYDKFADNPMAMLYDQGNQQGPYATRTEFTTNVALGRLKDGKLYTDPLLYSDVYDVLGRIQDPTTETSSSSFGEGFVTTGARVINAYGTQSDSRRYSENFQYGLLGLPSDLFDDISLPDIYRFTGRSENSGVQLWSRVDKEEFNDDTFTSSSSQISGATFNNESSDSAKRNLLTGVIDKSLGER